jgi:hypothetical protein
MNPTSTVVALLATFAGPSLALAAGRPVANEVKSYQKYFSNGEKAVLNGAVVPHAQLETGGLQARALLGVDVNAGKGSVTVKGIETPVKVVSAGISAGLDVGAGPRVQELTVIGKRGMTAKQVIPTSNNGGELGAIKETIGTTGNRGQELVGKEVGLRAGFAAELTGMATFHGSAREGPMLRRLEQGKALASKAQTALDKGDTAEATRLVVQMDGIRGEVSAEKQNLNRVVHSIYDPSKPNEGPRSTQSMLIGVER